ncbi:MAG: lytic transglycosylase [Candidatus Viridilinea halotolerans]|uniref:Lytic transglycosylase n=1 Tax=Candidatus Viridilinea halotolerans TaxID=2491704 RepID=A0A426TV39_9CHLR|nr:MAG: lytic transglycosylase [Candidatus Viridilinea halotolerans]
MKCLLQILGLGLFVFSLGACELVEMVEAPPITPTAVLAPSVVQPPPTPAPSAGVLLDQALRALAQGDDGAAALIFSDLLQHYPETQEALPARYYLATHYALRGRWTSAAELLSWFLAQAPADDPLRAPALFWLGRTHEAAGNHAAASEIFASYRALGTSIEPYAALRQAAQERALGHNEAALASFLHAARSSLVPGERAGAFEKAIALHVAAGRPTEVLNLYVELLDLAQLPNYRARILGEALALAQAQGEEALARDWLLLLVSEADLRATPQAAAAAEQLLAAGDAALTPASAGLIFAANERWAAAVAQLELAAVAETDPEQRTVLLQQQGLALRAQGDFAAALVRLSEAAALVPDTAAGRQAQLAWIQTLGQSGAIDEAIRGYIEYAANHTDDALAPVALDRAVQLYERLGDAAGAQQTRIALGEGFPTSAEGQAALHRVALELLDSGQPVAARVFWQALAEANSGAVRARGAFWAGRAAREAGDAEAARQLFVAAQAAAPASYEGARAAEELGGPPQGELALDAPISAAQWAELEDWVAAWASDEPVTPPDQPLALTVERTAQLEAVGLQREALAAWLHALDQRPAARDRLALARVAHADGATYPALLAAERLARQAPASAPPPPSALQRLRFPTPYPELVQRESAAHGIDPRLFYALMRQESLFNPGATSWVGARGLGQVMPATGEGIAQNLGVTDFVLDDLYRPAVSIRFGAFYLGQRIVDMQGSVHGALAAYNGGLGNAQRWAGGSVVDDPDRYTEQIDFAETRGYVRSVYGFWGFYQTLYAAE